MCKYVTISRIKNCVEGFGNGSNAVHDDEICVWDNAGGGMGMDDGI